MSNPRKIPEPYRFLGYLYYRVKSKPWKYDCAEVCKGLVLIYCPEKMTNTQSVHDYDNMPENDPDIMVEVEKLRKEKR